MRSPREPIGQPPAIWPAPVPVEPPADSGGAPEDEGFLDRFPEAVAAGEQPQGARGPNGARGYRIVLYASLTVGAVTGLSLVAAWILQAVLTGSYIRAGRDYFSSGVEAVAARELLSIPVGGFVAVLLVCLLGLCIGVWGIQRGAKA